MKTIILTGCNKGIGYGILEELVKGQQTFNIIMACRNIQLAEIAKENVLKFQPDTKSQLHILQLDISNKSSIEEFINNFKNKFQNFDVLINNAGFAWKNNEFNENVVEITFKTNYFGTKYLTEQIISLINNSGKIINIASKVGIYEKCISSEQIKKRFEEGEDLEILYKEYLGSVKDDKVEERGWKKWGYANSKLFLNVFTQRLSKEQWVIDRDVQVYSCCPGWIKTDMAGPHAPGTIQQGAQTPIFLLNLSNHIHPIYQGQFFQNQALSSI